MFSCAEIGLQPGAYYADIAVEQYGEPDLIDCKYYCATIRVDQGKSFWGNFYTPHRWQFEYDAGRYEVEGSKQRFGEPTST